MPNTPTRFPALAVVLSSLAALCLAEDHQPKQPEEPRMLTAQAERPPLDREAPARFETASFAVGWFWTPDSQFGSIPGILRTRVGYAGGTKENPTYHDLGDHTEAIQLDFDPQQISYRQIMEKFWRCHNPCARPWSRQYRSAVFYADEEQKKIAEETRAEFEKERGKTHTAVEALKKFYWAEDYHQKYTLRRHKGICQELERCYPRLEDFVNSTAATRVNSYLSGYGTKAQLEAEIEKLGISEESKAALRERVDK